ncbi:unnamed protein product, partial [Amoebophrya sp. A120]
LEWRSTSAVARALSSTCRVAPRLLVVVVGPGLLAHWGLMGLLGGSQARAHLSRCAAVCGMCNNRRGPGGGVSFEGRGMKAPATRAPGTLSAGMQEGWQFLFWGIMYFLRRAAGGAGTGIRVL